MSINYTEGLTRRELFYQLNREAIPVSYTGPDSSEIKTLIQAACGIFILAFSALFCLALIWPSQHIHAFWQFSCVTVSIIGSLVVIIALAALGMSIYRTCYLDAKLTREEWEKEIRKSQKLLQVQQDAYEAKRAAQRQMDEEKRRQEQAKARNPDQKIELLNDIIINKKF